MYINLLKAIIVLEQHESPLGIKIAIITLSVITGLLFILTIFGGLFRFLEMAQVEYFKKKQFFTHFYIIRRRLPVTYKSILDKEFSFYKKLTESEKKNFDHRVLYYLKNWEFTGKNIEITNTMRVLVSATAAKVTFGLRDYKIGSIDKIIIYPKAFYSNVNKQMHKGEFNMAHHALIFSWEDFLSGYAIADDNINLGVHEFIHAVHFYSLTTRKYSTSAAIFLDSLYELTDMLDSDYELKQKLITSGYFRDYAFENQFEFISVLVENFIETPTLFRSKFPKIYNKVKEMLNFDFAGY